MSRLEETAAALRTSTLSIRRPQREPEVWPDARAGHLASGAKGLSRLVVAHGLAGLQPDLVCWSSPTDVDHGNLSETEGKDGFEPAQTLKRSSRRHSRSTPLSSPPSPLLSAAPQCEGSRSGRTGGTLFGHDRCKPGDLRGSGVSPGGLSADELVQAQDAMISVALRDSRLQKIERTMSDLFWLTDA